MLCLFCIHRPAAFAADDGQVLCDASCVSKLESMAAVTTPSGLQYKDIVVGTGAAAAASAGLDQVRCLLFRCYQHGCTACSLAGVCSSCICWGC
jgi:hypothetical protein